MRLLLNIANKYHASKLMIQIFHGLRTYLLIPIRDQFVLTILCTEIGEMG